MAISGYSMDDYFAVNGHFRNSLDLQAKEKARVVAISEKISSALDKIRCQSDIKVFRGAQSGKSVFPEMKTGKTLEDCVKDYVKSQKPVVLSGFTSTSVLREKAANFGWDVQFEINVPKGAKAAFIMSESQVREEMEMLLDLDTKVRITGYREYFCKEKSRIIKIVSMDVI